jgi:hypothetical protein
MPIDGSVFVAFDSRAIGLPSWMNGFSETGKRIETSLASQPYLSVYGKNFEAGACADLGGNKASGFEGNAVGNYIVFYGPVDNCPNDKNKTQPGVCGRGIPDTDSDGDGIPDCNDDCSSLRDSDADGVGDCDDGCPFDTDKTEPGICGCGIDDVDSDGDGIPDCNHVSKEEDKVNTLGNGGGGGSGGCFIGAAADAH